MKKILKYSTILGAAALITGSAIADTGGYVRVKGFESHFQSFGFNQVGCTKGPGADKVNECMLASELSDKRTPNSGATGAVRDNTLHWTEDDGEGLVVGADFGFFRLEVEGTINTVKPHHGEVIQQQVVQFTKQDFLVTLLLNHLIY